MGFNLWIKMVVVLYGSHLYLGKSKRESGINVEKINKVYIKAAEEAVSISNLAIYV